MSARRHSAAPPSHPGLATSRTIGTGASARGDPRAERPIDRLGLGLILAGFLLAFALAWSLGKDAVGATLVVVNGLDQVVVATLDGGEWEVGPESSVEIPFDPSSATTLQVSARLVGGDVLDTATVRPDRQHELVAFNVLGAAPIYWERIHYGHQARESEYRFLGGRGSVLLERDVDYPFRPTPDEIRVHGSWDTRTTTYQIDGGWRATAEILAYDEEDPVAAVNQVLRVVEALPPDEERTQFALDFVREHAPPDDVERLVQRLDR